MQKKLIIFGASRQAKCIYKVLKFEGIEADGFCVDKEYKKEDIYVGKPLYSTDEFIHQCSPQEYIMLLPISFVNRCVFRKEKYLQFKNLGYDFYTHISKYALVYTDRENIGKNVYIASNTMIQPDVKIEDNSYISEGSQIGHDTHIHQHCFIGPQTTIGGSCDIGEGVHVGVGTVIREYVKVVSGAILGMGTAIYRDVESPGVHLHTLSYEPRIRHK